MNIKMRYLIIIVVGMLIAVNSVSADESKTVVKGVGLNSCGKFLANTQDDYTFEFAYISWAHGFMSGLNYDFIMDSAETAADLSDTAAQQISIENYCKENPLQLYAAAIFNLWDELRDTQGLEPDVRFIPKD